jgi:hypothetical protein
LPSSHAEEVPVTQAFRSGYREDTTFEWLLLLALPFGLAISVIMLAILALPAAIISFALRRIFRTP